MSRPENQVAPRLAPAQLEVLLVHMIRFEPLLSEAMELAGSDLFHHPGEQVYDAVWRALTNYKREQGIMPTFTILTAQACSAIQGGIAYQGSSNPINLRSAVDPNAFYHSVDLFVRTAFLPDISHLDINYGRALLRRLLNERTVVDMLRDVVSSTGSHDVMVNVPDVLNRISVQDMRIKALGANTGYGILDHAHGQEARVRYPTGISYIDKATSPVSTEVATSADADLTGGWLPAETYLILGPQGGGKTQTSLMITVEASDRYPNGLRHDPPGTRRGGYYFHYEMPAQQMTQRAIAYAARIPTHRLLGRDYRQNFSDAAYPQSWQPYEIPWIHEDQRLGRPPRAEKQRFEELATRMATWRSFKMHGTENGVPVGIGGIKEIVAKIDNSISRDGVVPSVVVIDYAKVCVVRKLQFANKDLDKNMRYELTSFADQCTQLIGERYGCGVFVMHQLKGQCNSKPPSYVPHHSEAGECSAMGEQFDYCFTYGVRSQENNCMWFNASKTRDSEGLRGPVIVRMEGAFSRIVEATDVISVNGTFRATREVSSVVNVQHRPPTASNRSVDI